MQLKAVSKYQKLVALLKLYLTLGAAQIPRLTPTPLAPELQPLSGPQEMPSATEDRNKMFEDFRSELWKRELSNAENFDKAILAYSSAGLAFSLGVLRDFIPISKALIPWALYASWSLFTLAIVSTIFSYMLSQIGIKQQITRAEEYYLRYQEDAYHQRNCLAWWTEATNFASGFFFVAAVVLTTVFVSFNLSGETAMTDSKKVLAKDGAPVPNFQKTPEVIQKGAPIPNLQKVPQPQPQQPAQPAKEKGS